eukprot:5703524-Prymnesium_polylepis.1
MRDRTFANSEEVVKYALNAIQAGWHHTDESRDENDEVAKERCIVVLFMVREVGAGAGRLWLKAKSKAESIGDLASTFKVGEIWSEKQEGPITAALYDVLASKQPTKTRDEHGQWLLFPLTQLDGHVYGVVLNGMEPAPEPYVEMIANAVGPVFERAH